MEPGPFNIIGKRVCELRERLRLTQEQLTARCQVLGLNISRTALAKIETQKRGVADHEALLIASALRIPVGELFPKKAPAVKRRHPNPAGPTRKGSVKKRKRPL